MNDVRPGSKPFRHAGGVFGRMHDELMGAPIDFGALDVSGVDEALLARARRTWQHRALTEFKSIQIMTRFMTEVLAAGDPLEVYAGAADLIADEIRHTALCVGLCEALGIAPRLPETLESEEREGFATLPAPQRALITAINMLCINETLSVGFVEDLAARCDDPVIGAVLRATCEDEETHQDFGWEYTRRALDRFPPAARTMARDIVQQTLAPHRRNVEPILDTIPAAKRDLDAWPEPELVRLGLFSRERQALVWDRTYRTAVAPRLVELGLL